MAVLPAVGRFCLLCVSTWSLGYEALRDERGNELFVFVFVTKFFESKGHVFDCALLGARIWSETGRFIFLWGCAIFKVGFAFLVLVVSNPFLFLSNELTNSCQFGAARKTGCFVGVFSFLLQLRTKIGFSRFCFRFVLFCFA